MYISEQQVNLKTNFLLRQQYNIQTEYCRKCGLILSGQYPPGITKIPSVIAAGQFLQLCHFCAPLENWHVLQSTSSWCRQAGTWIA